MSHPSSPGFPSAIDALYVDIASQIVSVGDMAREVLERGDVVVQAKGEHDLVTDVDLRCERELIALIHDRCPGDSILAEESETSARGGERMWAIDPIDGTANFAAGLPAYAVSVALFVSGEPEFGVVYDPSRRELFAAQRGRGATLGDRRLNIGAIAAPHQALVPLGVSTRAAATLIAHAPDTLEQIGRRFGKFRNLGSQALHLCYVAAGRMAAAVSHEAKLWDDAAGALIVSEAGGLYGSTDASEPVGLHVGPGDPRWKGAARASIAARSDIFHELRAKLGALR